MNKCIIAVGIGTVAVASAAHGDTFSSETDFVNAIQSDYYLETFDDLGFGTVNAPTWDAPGANGYEWTASGDPGNLYSVPGALSTDVAEDAINISFTGLEATAFGGDFLGTDFDGNAIESDVTVTLSNGDSHVLENQTGDTFFGWVGDTAIDSITITADAGADTLAWPAVDNFYVGQAIPAPGALALLGLAGLTARRRRA